MELLQRFIFKLELIVFSYLNIYKKNVFIFVTFSVSFYSILFLTFVLKMVIFERAIRLGCNFFFSHTKFFFLGVRKFQTWLFFPLSHHKLEIREGGTIQFLYLSKYSNDIVVRNCKCIDTD